MIPLGVVRMTTITLGGLLPAFASFRALEEGDAAGQRALLAYWVVFAALTAAEVPADAALSWLPLYGEAKLALLLWLLTPRLAGALQLYRGPLAGWLRRHQRSIERTLQHGQMQHGAWALAALLRGAAGVVITLARAAWLVAPPAAAAAPPPPPQSPPQQLLCDSTLHPAAAAAEAAGLDEVRPTSGSPAPPLDTAQLTQLGAGLEESCAMLLRTALAAQAGNQLLASLHTQSAVLASHHQPPLIGPRKRHSRRRIVTSAASRITGAAAAAESRPGEGPAESGEERNVLYSNPAVVGRPDCQ